MTPALVDTGPLVAILSPTDRHHTVCVDQLATVTTPLLTCWPVLTEAAWLLRRRPTAVQQLLRSTVRGWLRIPELPPDAGRWLADFMQRYQDTGVQLADACLMYLADTTGVDTVLTLDRRDFAIYRTTQGQALTMLPELGS